VGAGLRRAGDAVHRVSPGLQAPPRAPGEPTMLCSIASVKL